MKKIFVILLIISLIVSWFNAHWSVSLSLTLLFLAIVYDSNIFSERINKISNTK